jgi:Basic region leucine zipper
MQAKEQAERRKERNRLLARRTRLRKKFFYQSLQQQMKGLRDHNARLKRILKERLGDEQADKVCLLYSTTIYSNYSNALSVCSVSELLCRCR